MDPGARRKAWELIRQAVNRGCSVVLTSHSMEECEALCHRLVIMVAGSFQCIGSVQYLKDKFGSKYTFKLKVRQRSGTRETESLERHLGDQRQNRSMLTIIFFANFIPRVLCRCAVSMYLPVRKLHRKFLFSTHRALFQSIS